MERFSSRYGLILAALGMAIGTGNIWRFPRILAEYGGTFLLPWLVFLATWSIPLLIIESAMGKAARRGTVGTFATLLGPRFTWRGAWIGFCTMAIGFYYAVVTGWCLKYLLLSVSGGLTTADSESTWASFVASPYQQVFFQLLTLVLCVGIVARGINRGIERANRILIPSLFLILIVAAIRSVTLPGASEGLNFLFSFRAEQLLDYRIWLAGLSQSAWSTGAGAGFVLTYAAYARRRQNLVHFSFATGLGNNAASLLAALAVIPAVFAVLPREQALAAVTQPGPASTGMTFVFLPRVFQDIPGGTTVFQPLFFLALSLAAVSSMIAVIELGVRNLVDFNFSRRRAVGVMFLGTFLFGLPSALSSNFFLNQDWVWGLGLSISGLFVALAARTIGRERLLEWINDSPGWKVGRRFIWFVFWIVPLQLFVLLGWWLYRSIADDTGAWWDPFRTYSFGTTVAQWAIALALFFGLNRVLNARLAAVDDKR